MTYQEFLALAAEEAEKNPQMRYGQVWFNLLTTHRPELSHGIVATELDPFHKDVVSEATHAHIQNKW